MADCGTFVVWNHVEGDSELKAKTRGTTANYDARIRIVVNHDPSIFWERDVLDPGTASHPIKAGDHIVAVPRVVAVGADPATVTMEMWIEKSGVRIRECTWTITPAMMPFQALIVVGADA